MDTDNINKIQTKEKMERDKKTHEIWAQLELHEVNYTNNHDFMTENP